MRLGLLKTPCFSWARVSLGYLPGTRQCRKTLYNNDFREIRIDFGQDRQLVGTGIAKWRSHEMNDQPIVLLAVRGRNGYP